MVRLGAAYRADAQPDCARALLESAIQADPANGGAVLFLGITYEDIGELGRARQLYESYLAMGAPSPLRRQVEGRLPLLRRREFEIAVRQAIGFTRLPLRIRTIVPTWAWIPGSWLRRQEVRRGSWE